MIILRTDVKFGKIQQIKLHDVCLDEFHLLDKVKTYLILLCNNIYHSTYEE